MQGNAPLIVNAELIECCKCAMPFALSSDFIARRRKNGKTFYCPRGHAMHFPDNETDRKERDAKLLEVHRREQAEAKAAEESSRTVPTTAAGQVRVVDGLLACPECDRRYRVGSDLWLARHLRKYHGYDQPRIQSAFPTA